MAKRAGGRPPSLTGKDKERIIRLAKFGFTDVQIAEVFGITQQTLNNYKNADSQFFESLKSAKLEADLDVIDSLYQRAKGYSHPEEKQFFDSKLGEVVTHQCVKHYPPDTVAAIFWLKNRQPEQWREKQELDHGGEIEVHVAQHNKGGK